MIPVIVAVSEHSQFVGTLDEFGLLDADTIHFHDMEAGSTLADDFNTNPLIRSGLEALVYDVDLCDTLNCVADLNFPIRTPAQM